MEKYPHIHMLNNFSLPKDNTTVFKYMPLNRFVNSIKEKNLVFVSPNAWYDPFEQLYYGIDCSSRGYKTENIACMCVSEKSSTNEDASWRVYSESNDKAVRISFDYDKLLQLLEEYASNKGFEVYIGKVDYSLKKDEIKKLYLHTSDNHLKYFPNEMTREHYLSLMLLKRTAFRYENEVRIFLVKEKIEFTNNLLKIDCDYYAKKLISKVILSPYPPIREYGDVAYKVRRKINNIESAQIKKELKNILGCDIKQSLLYKTYEKIESID
jgi:hypothetical protein